MISSRDVSVEKCFQNFTIIITSAKKAMLSLLSVFLLATVRKKSPNGNFHGRLAMGQRTND